MALASNEKLLGGIVVDKTTGNIVTTTSTVGAVMSGGLLKDPDGRLVVMLV
jgi:hypothetical protein